MINVVAVAIFMITAIVFMKYKVCLEVTTDGETLGYISDKEKFEQTINEVINKEEENKLYTILAKEPKYSLKFVNKDEIINDEEVVNAVLETAETTYKFYAITVNGEEKETVKNLEEAEKLVEELSKKYEDTIEAQIAVVEVFTMEKNYSTSSIQIAKENLTNELDKQREKEYIEKLSEIAGTEVEPLNGIILTVKPVSGIITSRFGGRESIRSSAHSGLDIAAPRGTDIKAAADGTVIFAGYSGGYGNLVKISHGNGIVTYYGHCSALYVSTGEEIKAGDVIAAVGSTGYSTGDHLHFEIVKDGNVLDPEYYLYN